MNDSKLAMWKSLIALAYVDGELEPQEKAVLLGHIRGSKLPEETKAELISSIDTHHDFAAVFSNVSSPEDKAHVISTALVLFHSDADFEPAERKLFELLSAQQRELVDYAGAQKQARDYVAKFKIEDANAARAEYAKGGRIMRMVGYIAEKLP